MAFRGTNNLIQDFRKNIENVINDGLKTGIPPSVVKMCLDLYSNMNDGILTNVIQQEDVRYGEQLAEEKNKESELETTE